MLIEALGEIVGLLILPLVLLFERVFPPNRSDEDATDALIFGEGAPCPHE